MVKHEYIIGIDGGGSHCRAVLQNSNGKLVGEGVSGASNIMSDPHQTLQSIVSACEAAIADANLSVSLSELVVMAGLAGANIPKAKTYFLSLPMPFKRIHVMSDLHAACFGAHEGANGGLIICGTGSAATCHRDGTFKDIGGYGLSLGDNGSAAWLGLQAVKNTLLAMDGVHQESTLAKRVVEQLQARTASDIVTITSSYKPSHYGELAPLVTACYEAGCETATEIIREGARYIHSIINTLNEYYRSFCKTAGDSSVMPVCVVGGLAQTYIPLLPNDIQQALCTPKTNAQRGAIGYFSQVDSAKDKVKEGVK
jgi:glucosamine kinase